MASLHIAVLFGNESLTRTLLDEGYDANVFDERLGTPLSIAILRGYRSIVNLLSENGASHNDEKFTSALIHSRLDEFNLPSIASDLNADNEGRAQASKAKDRSDAQPHARPSIGDDNKTERAIPIDMETVKKSGTGPDVFIGSESEIKILFKNGSEWDDHPGGEATPMTCDVVQSVEGVHNAYAVVQYMEPNGDGGWVVSKIDIHGSKLCGFLSRVLENYPGAGIGHLKATLYPTMPRILDPDFMGLFHRMERYNQLSGEEIDPVTKEQATLLLQVLKSTWDPIQYVVEESRATRRMTWATLWTIFQPGDIVILKPEDEDDNDLLAARLVKFELIPERFDRDSRYEATIKIIDWNGSYTGYRKGTYPITKYEKFKKLVDIGVYPLSYDPDPERLKERLVQRGRKFESLRGYFFMTRVDFSVTRRVVIDNYAYYRFQEGHVPTYAKLHGQSPVDEQSSDYDDNGREGFLQALARSSSRTRKVRSSHNDRQEDLRPLTDDECLLCVSTMKGFDVQEKKWHDIRVDDFQSITWNDEAFNQLAMEEERKRLVLAFAKQKQSEATGFDDFITGKGKSFIILLCGPPGVGKTLTAESVAERTRAPLYILSAGDLGTDAERVERSLKKALEMCALWRAIMLIDEADVFLEARTTDNIERNELVSVFLRLLEYYKGTLFLTTNREATIDRAFESRIDLILPYDDFDQAARRQIWTNFAYSLVDGSHELCDAHFDELSKQKLNGREIKSTMKTALMLANSDEKKLQMEHLKIVLRVRQRAAEYLHTEASGGSRGCAAI
ncbi:hypothetical protein HD806DRAFT_511148 [Xylariaceae sp. AK1471]|nr:hypothetical protein HD806DRAFT_511148 [Xylariaceae sp. AK1471]